MAPPGILSVDEHLDAVRTTCKNISVPSFSPQSKRSGSAAKEATASIFHDHDYVLHQQLFCESSTDSNYYEEIDIASINFDDFVSKTVTQMSDATGVDDSTYTRNKTMVPSKHGVDNSKCHLIGTNDARLTENVDSNNTPRSRSTSWFMDDLDDDFLDGLDTFDLELDEFDPCIDMDTEDSFQQFIEETLNGAATNAYMDDEYELLGVTDEEDRHKKEYFLKLLGLQSVSHETQNKLTFLEECATNTTRHHTFAEESSSISKSIDGSNDVVCQGKSHCFAAHPNSVSASVPAKMCSCTATDWKDSLLYSTAPVCSNGRVQTNLSTAQTKSVAYHMASQNFRFTSNDSTNCHSSPSLEPINNFEDVTPCSLLGGGVSQLKNHSDADAFLRWLEEDGETMSSTQASTELSEGSKCTATSYKNMSAQSKSDDTNCVPEPNNLSAGHSVLDTDMDSFIDLETYAMEKSPSVIQFGRDAHPSSCLSIHSRDATFDTEEILGCMESKYPPSSELRFRLSLLDEGSCRKDRYLEKRDASCQFSISDEGVNASCKGYTFDDPLADFTSDAASSPLSPYSSSSVHSSYGQTKGAEDSLDLLGLFSEENSFLLLEQSDSRYGFC